MARVLILGGGCRGLQLTRALVQDGHLTRIVTRQASRRDEIEAAGAECWIGDPDRLGTLRGVLEGVVLVCWLLGTASGDPDRLGALHGSRLRSFLASAVDSAVRGVIYEAAGNTMPPGALAAGAEIARQVTSSNSVPLALIEADPACPEAWVSAAREAIGSLLRGRGAIATDAAPG